jgi:hypothetical protein
MFGTSVFDKIKSDFNSVKGRCHHIKSYGSDKESSDAWNELFDRIKEGILASFSQQVQALEEEAAKVEEQRDLPGWNYFSYFIVKENLAFVYELMGIYDDALVQYDDLAEQYLQALSGEGGASWFSDFGARDVGDDCYDVLDVSHKKYRELIQ